MTTKMKSQTKKLKVNDWKIQLTSESLQMNIYLEFYEDEYLLEELNNPNYVETTFYNLGGALPLCTKVNYDLVKNKRINFNRNNINELIISNVEIEVEYKGDD